MKFFQGTISGAVAMLLGTALLPLFFESSDSDNIEVSSQVIEVPAYEIFQHFREEAPQIFEALKEALPEEKRRAVSFGLLGFHVLKVHQITITNTGEKVVEKLSARVKTNTLTFARDERDNITSYTDEQINFAIRPLFPDETTSLLILNEKNYTSDNVDIFIDGRKIDNIGRFYDQSHILSWWLDYFIDEESPQPFFVAIFIVIFVITMFLTMCFAIWRSVDENVKIKTADTHSLGKTVDFLNLLKLRHPDKFRQVIAASKCDNVDFHHRQEDLENDQTK